MFPVRNAEPECSKFEMPVVEIGERDSRVFGGVRDADTGRG